MLEQLSNSSTTEIPEDPILTDHISGKGITDFLYFNRNNIKSIIPVFERFLNLTDYNLQDYLRNFSGQLNPIDATQLGRLIATRGFANSAYVINSKATKSNSWRFALAESSFLLDFWTKLALSISGILAETDISSTEWWESTESLIIELYPNGTSLTTVWKKAGGKESDLLTKGTASEIWSDVFHKFKIGAYKGISMNDLLKEIKKQYGDNQKFQMIYDLRKSILKT